MNPQFVTPMNEIKPVSDLTGALANQAQDPTMGFRGRPAWENWWKQWESNLGRADREHSLMV